MTVIELIEELMALPPDANIECHESVWDDGQFRFNWVFDAEFVYQEDAAVVISNGLPDRCVRVEFEECEGLQQEDRDE